MGLKDDIQADLAVAFDTDLADALKPFTGGITKPGVYDPVTEEITDPVVIEYSGRGFSILLRYTVWITSISLMVIRC